LVSRESYPSLSTLTLTRLRGVHSNYTQLLQRYVAVFDPTFTHCLNALEGVERCQTLYWYSCRF